jgi:hypothetical protein
LSAAYALAFFWGHCPWGAWRGVAFAGLHEKLIGRVPLREQSRLSTVCPQLVHRLSTGCSAEKRGVLGAVHILVCLDIAGEKSPHSHNVYCGNVRKC